ncbi:MAG: penicillin-binding protein activator [Candidatus Woesearchaeota archaeon]|nr:penicillin-binding protein activator [Candidatus Woesearchaeota archaeon]
MTYLTNRGDTVKKLALLFVVFLVACAPTENKTDTVKVGVIAPLTGELASLGVPTKEAVVMAIEEENAKGGTQIELIVEDGKCNGRDATTAASKLLNIDGVEFLIGPLCSPSILGMAPMANDLGRVAVSMCASAPAVTDAGDYIFRTYPSDAFQAKEIAEHLHEQGYRNIAILSCLNEWCKGNHDVLKENFEALGGAVAIEENFDGASRDLRSQFGKIQEATPDALAFFGFTESSIVGIKQMRELGVELYTLGGDAWNDPKIAQEVGESGNGIQHIAPVITTPEGFAEKLEARTGSPDVPVCVLQGYDTGKIFAKLIKEGATTADAFRDALYAMPEYQGISGPIVFDENGDLKNAVYALYEYKDGDVIVAEETV